MKKVLLGIIFGLWILSGCTDKIKNVRISGLNEVFIDEEITLTLNKTSIKSGGLHQIMILQLLMKGL